MTITEAEYQAMRQRAPIVRLNDTLAQLKPRKKPTYKTPESAVKAACMGWLAAHKVFAWRNNSGAVKTESGFWLKFGLKGSSDILGICKNGRFLAVECKSDIGQLRDEQKLFRDNVMANGGLFIVARSTDDLEKHRAEIVG